MTTATPLPIGVIGAGTISDQYLSTFAQHPQVFVAFLAARNAERLRAQQRRYNISSIGTVEQLLADDRIRVVVNLTPPTEHLSVGLAVLEAGKHLWTEKPLATSLPDAQILMEAARTRGLRIGTAPDTFLGPAHQKALAAIRQGKIGAPRTATATMEYWGPHRWHPNPGFLYRPGGGPLLDMGPYWLTLLAQVFGPAKSVYAHGHTSSAPRKVTGGPQAGEVITPEVPTYVSALISYESGAKATCTFSFDSESKDLALKITGDTGVVKFAEPQGFEGAVDLVQGDVPTEITGPGTAVHAGRGIGVVEFAAAVRNGQPSQTEADLGYHVLEIMLAITTAMELDQPVPVTSNFSSRACLKGVMGGTALAQAGDL